MPYNPLYLFTPAALILFSLPLIVTAFFTTAIATVVLSCHASILYLELGFSIARAFFFPGRNANTKLPMPVIAPNPEELRLRRRRSSMFGQLQPPLGEGGSSNGTTGLTNGANGANENGGRKRPLQKTDSFASLLGSGHGNRDYEGIGGWRDINDEGEESVWLNINRRLQLPADRQTMRNHQRSLTGGSSKFVHSPEMIRMSPVQSRARTPSVHSLADNGSGAISPEEYFGLQPHRHSVIAEQTPVPPHVRGMGLGLDSAGNGRRKSISEDQVNDVNAISRSRRKSTGAESSSSSSSARSGRIAATKQTAFA